MQGNERIRKRKWYDEDKEKDGECIRWTQYESGFNLQLQKQQMEMIEMKAHTGSLKKGQRKRNRRTKIEWNKLPLSNVALQWSIHVVYFVIYED